jgi:alkyldihydroxyacetonephosphate synthase
MMTRWNGWGYKNVSYPLHDTALRHVEEWVGPSVPPRDATLEDVIRTVPPSRLPAHPLINTEPQPRVLRARGQSLPDWIALRSGRIPVFPDGVALPASAGEVRDLIQYALAAGVRLIPYGGGN